MSDHSNCNFSLVLGNVPAFQHLSRCQGIERGRLGGLKLSLPVQHHRHQHPHDRHVDGRLNYGNHWGSSRGRFGLAAEASLGRAGGEDHGPGNEDWQLRRQTREADGQALLHRAAQVPA